MVENMTLACQGGPPVGTLAVAGVAGSGKSTLGRALATALRLPLLDLDAVTNPLLDRLVGPVLSDALAGRAARRADPRGAVRRAARGRARRRGDGGWRGVGRAVHRRADRRLGVDGTARRGRAHRVAGRPHRRRSRAARAQAGSPRGGAATAHRPQRPARPPAVPHIAIAAALTPEQQLTRALRALGHRTAVDPGNPLFGQPFDAVLFDLDGVLVDSTASVTRSWDRFAAEFNVSSAALQENHGQPAQTLVDRLLGPDRVAEGLARIEAIEVDDAAGVEAVPGAQALFASLPEDRRAVVTSGTPPIATARLRAGGFPLPRTLITADDIERGKPDPQPYLLAAHRLGVPPDRCLAVEDAPAGIASARAAGCQVLAVTGTAEAEELAAAALIVDGLDRVAVRVDGDVLRLEPGKPQ